MQSQSAPRSLHHVPNASVTSRDLPFGLTRFLSWISLVLILASSVTLAFFIGNSARSTLLLRQQDYARLMAANLNHQIYRRFTLPTFLAFGRIALRQPVQYQQLDEVVQSTIHGLHVEELRIYGGDNIVNYSIENSELGRTDLTPEGVPLVMKDGRPSFEILSNVDMFKAMFTLDLPRRSYMLRTLFPLSVEIGVNKATGQKESLTTGVLEIKQDITDDYDNVIRFQWLILATCLGSSTVLFALLQFFIFKAERTLRERMAQTRKLQDELHQNEKLAGMGRVVASIAHEIRNPLGIIRSSAELLLRRAEGENTSRRILEAVYDESCRLSQTVNDFLDYARPRIPRREHVDVNALLNQAQAFLNEELRRHGVELVRHVPEGLSVLGDKDLLYRAFYNILVNAMQAIEKEGVIRIRGKRREDGMVELAFHDSGPGFPPNELPRMLDPFFTTKDHGTGLGLPIVNTIIASHDGCMELSNPAGEGALVTLLLPSPEAAGSLAEPALIGGASMETFGIQTPEGAPAAPLNHQ